LQLLGLKLVNIGSLVGEHYIDFRKLGQISGGLYAFSGATGSGKSTLLSALTLALYARPLKSDLRAQDLMSLNATFSQVSLQILIQGELYDYFFNANMLKGKFYSDHYVEQAGRRLTVLPSQLLPIGFKHFCQTAILPQGEFSKYLTGSFSERKVILSRFIDEEKLDKFTKNLKDNYDQYQENSLKLNNRLEYLKQEIEKNEYAKLDCLRVKNEKTLTQLRPLLSWLKVLQILCRDLQKILLNHEQLKLRKRKNQDDLSPLTTELSILLEKDSAQATLYLDDRERLIDIQYHKLSLKLSELRPLVKELEKFPGETNASTSITTRLHEIDQMIRSKIHDNPSARSDQKYRQEIDLHRLIELEKSIHFLKNQQGILRETEESLWRNFYQTLAELKNLELPKNPEGYLTQECTTMFEQTIEALLKLEQIQDIESHLGLQSILSHLQESKLNNLNKHFEAELHRSQKELNEVFSLLKRIEEIQTSKNKLESELNNLNEKFAQVEVLHRHCNRDELKNFWLFKVEQDLLYFANIELDKIYEGRYQIFLRKQAQGQALYLRDSKYPDKARKVNTLSGGESFLISLCLSLALSSLSKNDQICEFFFIDEGFGSLDIESLDQAMEILSHFVNLGKNVGLISHVTELTERIPVRVQLIKDNHGHSTINIIGAEDNWHTRNLHS
jgi:DNA repair protein SbcC/Rad50